MSVVAEPINFIGGIESMGIVAVVMYAFSLNSNAQVAPALYGFLKIYRMQLAAVVKHKSHVFVVA